MKRCFIRLVCFTILIMVVSAGCSPLFAAKSTPTIVPTSTPEKLELINGELDPCQLINVTEVESIVSTKVVPRRMFAESAWWCTYYPRSDNGSAFLMIFVYTDASIKRANQALYKKLNSTEFDSAADVYEARKSVSQRMSEKMSTFKIEDIEDLGDQAFSTELESFQINILNNGIYYAFSTVPDSDVINGVSKEALMKLVQIALARMP